MSPSLSRAMSKARANLESSPNMLFFIIFEFHGHRKAGLEDFLTNITRFGLATLTSECSGVKCYKYLPIPNQFSSVMSMEPMVVTREGS